MSISLAPLDASQVELLTTAIAIGVHPFGVRDTLHECADACCASIDPRLLVTLAAHRDSAAVEPWSGGAPGSSRGDVSLNPMLGDVRSGSKGATCSCEMTTARQNERFGSRGRPMVRWRTAISEMATSRRRTVTRWRGLRAACSVSIATPASQPMSVSPAILQRGL